MIVFSVDVVYLLTYRKWLLFAHLVRPSRCLFRAILYKKSGKITFRFWGDIGYFPLRPTLSNM